VQEDIAKMRPYNYMLTTLLALRVPKEWVVSGIKNKNAPLFEYLENV